MALRCMYLFILISLPFGMMACGSSGSSGEGGELGALSVKGVEDGVIDISATGSAFAALMADGTVVAWGNKSSGGDASKVKDKLTDIIKVVGNEYAFAALKENGSVVTWGQERYGGDGQLWSRVGGRKIKDINPELQDVKDIIPSFIGFAALKKDGSVVAWGAGEYLDTAPLRNQLTQVKEVVGNGHAFAALKEDETIFAWGSDDNNYRFDSVKSQLRGVKKIYNTVSAFGALKKDGSFITWGKSDLGGNSSSAHLPLTHIKEVFVVDRAFAVLREDGRLTAWGDSKAGGRISSIQDQLVDIKKVFVSGDTFPRFSYGGAFGVLKEDRSVITWGHHLDGGRSGVVRDELYDIVGVLGSKSSGMAALRKDKTAIVWGLSQKEGERWADATYIIPDMSQLVFVGGSLFVGINTEGKAVLRGKTNSPILLEELEVQLTGGIKKAIETWGAFAFLKEDNSLVVFGDPTSGGVFGKSVSRY